MLLADRRTGINQEEQVPIEAQDCNAQADRGSAAEHGSESQLANSSLSLPTKCAYEDALYKWLDTKNILLGIRARPPVAASSLSVNTSF